MRLEALAPFTYRWPGGEIHLEPGRPVDLADDRARRLIQKAGDRVRVIESDPIVLEPASATARPIYWESMDGTWYGPAIPEYLERTGTGDHEQFWVITTYQGAIRWIRADRLRSRQAFEATRTGRDDPRQF